MTSTSGTRTHSRKQSQTNHGTSHSRARTKAARGAVAVTTRVAAGHLAKVRARLSNKLSTVRTKVVEGAKTTDRVVRANPYKAIGIAAVGGAMVGALISRRRRN